MVTSSIVGGCSGVTVHACMAADDLIASSSVPADVTPTRTDDALGTRNFASAVSGDQQNQPLLGSNRPRANDNRAEWLVEACNNAAGLGSGSNGRGGGTPGRAPTPMSLQMLSACATPPESFCPGMDDVRGSKTFRRQEA